MSSSQPSSKHHTRSLQGLQKALDKCQSDWDKNNKINKTKQSIDKTKNAAIVPPTQRSDVKSMFP